MDEQAAAVAAIVGYVVFLLLAFGVRSVVHYRRTGATGFVGISGRPGSTEWWGGMLFAVAIVATGAAPLLQLSGVVAEIHGGPFPAPAVGMILCAAGIAGTLWAQFAMGDAWRIGVDPEARTSLVRSGPFRWVRNPIYTAMSVATLGLLLLVPNAVSLLALGALIAALQIQVRLVEEPYLFRVHGPLYVQFAATTGRFLPGVGRMGSVLSRAGERGGGEA